jgi:hypothetical protein
MTPHPTTESSAAKRAHSSILIKVTCNSALLLVILHQFDTCSSLGVPVRLLLAIACCCDSPICSIGKDVARALLIDANPAYAVYLPWGTFLGSEVVAKSLGLGSNSIVYVAQY